VLWPTVPGRVVQRSVKSLSLGACPGTGRSGMVRRPSKAMAIMAVFHTEPNPTSGWGAGGWGLPSFDREVTKFLLRTLSQVAVDGRTGSA
jgi:hypothetical protein